MKKSLTALRTQRGFTLIELILVLVLAGVIMSLAVPNLSSFAKNGRLTGGANDMLAALYSARAEAIKQQVPAAMCFTTTPTASTPACDGNGTQGWITWIDTNGNAAVDAGEQVLIRHDALPGTLSVLRQGTSSANTVSYGANGFSRPVANTLTGVVLCDDRKNKLITGDTSAARGVIVDKTGRPSVTKSYLTINTNSSLLNNATTGTCAGG